MHRYIICSKAKKNSPILDLSQQTANVIKVNVDCHYYWQAYSYSASCAASLPIGQHEIIPLGETDNGVQVTRLRLLHSSDIYGASVMFYHYTACHSRDRQD